MLDHPYIGALYTLSNKRDNEFRQSLSIVIDLTVPHSGVGFILSGVSDPTAAYMSFHNVISYSPKPFKFFDIWTDHPKLCR